MKCHWKLRRYIKKYTFGQRKIQVYDISTSPKPLWKPKLRNQIFWTFGMVIEPWVFKRFWKLNGLLDNHPSVLDDRSGARTHWQIKLFPMKRVSESENAFWGRHIPKTRPGLLKHAPLERAWFSASVLYFSWLLGHPNHPQDEKLLFRNWVFWSA